MLGIKTPPRAPDADEAEKPFWISYSDLMTALMVLFLVAMSVSLFSITQKVISGPEQHEKKKEACMAEVSAMAKSEFPGVSVRGHTISFGTLAQFKLNDHKLDASAEATLRKFVPRVLALARTGQCKEVFKRVVVEGFASQSGTYIHNLNLRERNDSCAFCLILLLRMRFPRMTGRTSESCSSSAAGLSTISRTEDDPRRASALN